MEDTLEEGPLADELLELRAAESRFWDQVLLNPGCERYRRIAEELKCLGDAEGAAIFARRHMGWEISNNPEWLLDEVEQLRRTMPLPKAVRTATGKYL